MSKYFQIHTSLIFLKTRRNFSKELERQGRSFLELRITKQLLRRLSMKYLMAPGKDFQLKRILRPIEW